VYSAEQAKRGENVYGLQCASCHNSLGNHTGPIFRERWAGATVAELFVYTSESMPKGDPGSLSPQEYIDVTAYLLKMNGMPPGKTALPPDAVALAAFRFDTLPGK
jgi:mono/diheme cytochrome c family protein